MSSDADLIAAGAKRIERIGDALLILGDCREIAPKLPRPDAIVSDPPYGMAHDTDSTRFTGGAIKRGAGREDWGGIVADAEPFDPAQWLQAAPRVVLWGSNHYAQRLPVGRTLVWLKKHPDLYGTFLSDAEIGWCSDGHGVMAFYKQFPPPSRMAESNGTVAHPTQKPLDLMAWCIEAHAKLQPGALCLDPYMGSGTTGVACIRRGVRFVGIEIEPRYFDVACKRIAEAARQPSLFHEPAPKPAQLDLTYPVERMA